MSVDRPIPTVIIKYRGSFDYEKFYKTVADWFQDQGYELQEKTYKHKIPSPSGEEQELDWEAWRAVTDYTKFWIRIFMHTWDMNKVDVVKGGKKQKIYKGRIQIEISGRVELDWTNRFESSPFLQALRDFFHKYIWYKKITGGWEDELYYRIYKLHRVIKETLGMETPTDSSRYRY